MYRSNRSFNMPPPPPPGIPRAFNTFAVPGRREFDYQSLPGGEYVPNFFPLGFWGFVTGSPSSKYEHRRERHLLRNIQNIMICMGKKTCRFCNLRKWKDFTKKQLTVLKMCDTSLLCCPRADLWLFYGFLCKRFSKVGHSSEAARLIHRRKTAGNSLQLLQSPPNSA